MRTQTLGKEDPESLWLKIKKKMMISPAFRGGTTDQVNHIDWALKKAIGVPILGSMLNMLLRVTFGFYPLLRSSVDVCDFSAVRV